MNEEEIAKGSVRPIPEEMMTPPIVGRRVRYTPDPEAEDAGEPPRDGEVHDAERGDLLARFDGVKGLGWVPAKCCVLIDGGEA